MNSQLTAPLSSPDPKPQVLDLKTSIRGEYRCVLNEGTERESSTGWFENLITDIGLDRLGNVLVCNQYSSIGTGTATPVNGNTSLQAFAAEKSNVTGVDSGDNAGTPTYVAQTTMHWTYAQGAVVGNMAEVGVGWGTGGTNLFSRALILDGAGAPTTLTVTSIDQLTVYYRITVTPSLTDLTGTVTLGGATYNYVGRLANGGGWNASFINALNANDRWPEGYLVTSYSTQTLGAVSGVPSGPGLQNSGGSTTFGSYSAGQKYLDSTFNITPSECNSVGGVGAVVFFFASTHMSYQYSFANVAGGGTIPKDNTKSMTFTLRFSWDRA